MFRNQVVLDMVLCNLVADMRWRLYGVEVMVPTLLPPCSSLNIIFIIKAQAIICQKPVRDSSSNSTNSMQLFPANRHFNAAAE